MYGPMSVGAYRSGEATRASGVELQAAPPDVGAGSQTQVLCKSSACP